jgi:hypothetical protein
MCRVIALYAFTEHRPLFEKSLTINTGIWIDVEATTVNECEIQRRVHQSQFYQIDQILGLKPHPISHAFLPTFFNLSLRRLDPENH